MEKLNVESFIAGRLGWIYFGTARVNQIWKEKIKIKSNFTIM